VATKRRKQRAPVQCITSEVSSAPSLIERYHVERWQTQIGALVKKIAEEARTLDGCFNEEQVQYLVAVFSLELNHESHLLSHKDYHLTVAKRYQALCPFVDN